MIVPGPVLLFSSSCHKSDSVYMADRWSWRAALPGALTGAAREQRWKGKWARIGPNGDFPGDPVVKISPSNAGLQVQSLARELRSHMPGSEEVKYINKTVFKKKVKLGKEEVERRVF